MHHMYHASLDTPALHMSIGKDRSYTHPLFSNCTSDNCATENIKVMTSKSCSHLWLITNTTLYRPLRGCSKKGQFQTFTSHMHNTCEACWSKTGDAYVSLLYLRFWKRLHMKREGQSLYLPYWEEERSQVQRSVWDTDSQSCKKE
jgi:hypothetical protein